MTQSVPDLWFAEVQKELQPYVSPDSVVVDAATVERFKKLDGRAKAHAKAKGEHEGMTFLTIYAIWSNSLWRAEYDSWDDYCQDWDKEPFGLSASNIKHKMVDIDRLISNNVSPHTIIKALANIPTATKELAKQLNEKDDLTLPSGLNADEYLAEIAELGPVQASIAVEELTPKDKVVIRNVVYDPESREVTMQAELSAVNGTHLLADLYIPAVPQWAAFTLTQRLSRAYRR